MDTLNREGEYRCLYVNVEVGQAAREDVHQGMKAILSQLGSMAQAYLDDPFPDEVWEEALKKRGAYAALDYVLMLWARHSPEPLVLLIDEIDSLIGDTLIAVLRQLRTGYTRRPELFPQSIVLCGVRDVRDYRMYSSREKAMITGGSAFNVKAESLRLGDFSREEVAVLYQQHTEETGQRFESEAFDLVWELTQGQPWLVNALGYEVCFKMKEERDRTKSITSERVMRAKERLILLCTNSYSRFRRSSGSTQRVGSRGSTTRKLGRNCSCKPFFSEL